MKSLICNQKLPLNGKNFIDINSRALLSNWNEETLTELPAIKLLESLGYTYISSKQLEPERESLRNVIVKPRLRNALKRINPWLTESNIERSVEKITRIDRSSNIEINKKIHELFVHYFSIQQDRGNGKRPYTVKCIDFQNPENNEFLVTKQFKVQGNKKEIRCDIVCLINGMPIVVIEAKNPVATGSTPEQAIMQLLRYQEDTRGAPKLFHTCQILIATNRVEAFVGTNNTEKQHFLQWKDPYPMTVPELEQITKRKVTQQDIAIAGALNPKTILDIIQNFVIYEIQNRKIVKKIPRYHQYRAVNKTIMRILNTKKNGHKNTVSQEKMPSQVTIVENKTNEDIQYEKRRARDGVIWHTQGSGKSLTMLFLAIKLRNVKELENPTVIVVTDRINLDKQINATFRKTGFPSPIRAKSTNDLKNLIKQIDRVLGQTILTTIHKFQDKNRAKTYPKLANTENIVVLADEGHRTQYKTLALNMRTAMPNASFIAFTGTPLIKKENVTTKKFGNYIDKYSIDQSIKDKATVPIYYESRFTTLHVEKDTLDKLVALELEDYTDEEQARIRKRYANLRNVIGAERRIKKIALNLYEHFRKKIRINGFKAQIVAINRITATKYKNELDQLIKERHQIQAEVIYSSSPNDDGDLLKYQTTNEEQEKLIARFKDPHDNLSILIVVKKLLTGFDAPIEQVLYLDNILIYHDLLQAIARVNRTYKNKTYGLIVDYVGIAKHLKNALDIFEDENMDNTLIPFSEIVKKLETTRQEVMEMFKHVENKDDIDECINIITENQNTINMFMTKAQNFEDALDAILPDPIANSYKKNYIFTIKLKEYLKSIGKIGDNFSFHLVSMKIKKLIDEHVRATEMQLITKSISIFSPEFEEYLKNSPKSSKQHALIMEHQIKKEIDVKRKENPEFYDTLSQRLEKIIQAYKNQRLSEAEFIERLQPLIHQMQNIRKTAENLGMNETQFAFYNLLNKNIGSNNDETFNQVTKQVSLEILDELKEFAVLDWEVKNDIQRKMRRAIKLKLTTQNLDYNIIQTLTIKLVELARAHKIKN